MPKKINYFVMFRHEGLRYSVVFFFVAMLYFWHPFSGGSRVPSLVVFLFGLHLLASRWRDLLHDHGQRVWSGVVLSLALPNALSLFSTFSIEHTLSRIGLIFLVWVVGLVILDILSNRGWAVDLLSKIISLTVFIWILDALIQKKFGVDLLGVPAAGSDIHPRIVGFYGGHLYLPWSLVLGLPVLVWMLLNSRPLFAFVVIAMGGVVLLGTGVRSALVSWALVALFFLNYIKTRYKWGVAVALVCVILVGVLFSPVAKIKLQETRVSEFTFDQVNSLLNGRLYLWDAALKMIKDHPLLGVGGDAFREAYPSYVTRNDDPFVKGGSAGSQNVHQLYLSVLAETGIVGFIGLMVAFGLVASEYFRSDPEQKVMARPYVIGLLAVLFPVNSQPLIYKTWWIPLLTLFVAVLLASLRSKKAGV